MPSEIPLALMFTSMRSQPLDVCITAFHLPVPHQEPQSYHNLERSKQKLKPTGTQGKIRVLQDVNQNQKGSSLPQENIQ